VGRGSAFALQYGSCGFLPHRIDDGVCAQPTAAGRPKLGNDPSNFGLLFLMVANAGDGLALIASEHTNQAARPDLTVEYDP
jgi:hypothetical protein